MLQYFNESLSNVYIVLKLTTKFFRPSFPIKLLSSLICRRFIIGFNKDFPKNSHPRLVILLSRRSKTYKEFSFKRYFEITLKPSSPN